MKVRPGDEELKQGEVFFWVELFFAILQTKAAQTEEEERMCRILSNGPFLLIILSLSSSPSRKAQIISS